MAFEQSPCIHLLPDFQLDEGSDEEFQRTDGRLSLHVTDTQSCFGLRMPVCSTTLVILPLFPSPSQELSQFWQGVKV